MGIKIALSKCLGLVGALTLLSGCSSYRLYARVERMSPGSSVHQILDTPTPKGWKEPTGQRLVVSWVLPRASYSKDKLDLHLDVIFSKGCHEQLKVDSISRLGHWVFENSGAEIKERGHIATYKIWITDADKTIREFRHKLYQDWLDPDQIEEGHLHN